MSRSTYLMDLQQVDHRRDEAMAHLKRVVAALRGGTAVAQAKQAVGKAEEALSTVERQLRRQDLERQAVKDRIATEEKTLFGGKVNSPKELQNLQYEVASLKRRLGELDDTALELMLARDEAEERLTEARAALAGATTEVAAETETLAQEKAELTSVVRRLDADRQGILEYIAAPDRALYERLRKAKGGRAVALLSGEHCGACGMQLPRQVHYEAQHSEDIVCCTGCGRILHR